MQVTSYGLFWRADEIEWFPGKGNRNEFRLLGRVGKTRPKIKVADFRRQQGIYILSDEYGPAYVGLAMGDRLGNRLREHHSDHLEGKWDRFCWFGFNQVNNRAGKDGVRTLSEPPVDLTEDTSTTIKQLEALLIAAMGPKLNVKKMKFGGAEKWEQIGYWEWKEVYQTRITSEG